MNGTKELTILIHNMKRLKYRRKEYKYVNQREVDGVLYVAYRYNPGIGKKSKTLVTIDGKIKVIKDLIKFWEELK